MPTLRTLAVALVCCLLLPLAACGDPCQQLEVEVCKRIKDKQGCHLLRDKARRESLSNEWCEAVERRLKG